VISTSNIPEKDPTAAKRECREAGRAARCALDSEACTAAAAALAERLLALPELADAGMVLAYSATAEEISLAPTIAALRERGVAIAYPRVEERGVLAAHLVDDETDLVPGAMGILEPSAEAPRPDVSAIGAVIVPGVAFDERGARVGFGGGFYDRLLPLLTHAVLIGVAYDEQIAARVPLEAHDVIMDAVVTPRRAVRTGVRR
jgi:5-formyltetrahydrofolate cyclo-ligase